MISVGRAWWVSTRARAGAASLGSGSRVKGTATAGASSRRNPRSARSTGVLSHEVRARGVWEGRGISEINCAFCGRPSFTAGDQEPKPRIRGELTTRERATRARAPDAPPRCQLRA